MIRLIKYQLDDLIIFISAVFIMLLPRTFSIVGVYSFRAVIILCFALLLLAKRGKFKIKITNRITLNIFIFYVSYIFIRYLTSDLLASGIGFLIDSFVFFSLLSVILENEDKFNLFLNIFCKFMLIYAVLGIIESLTEFNIWYYIGEFDISKLRLRYGLNRSFGAFTNYMNNAAFLMLALPLLLWKIINSKKNKIYIIAYILVNINIIMTMTRTLVVAVMFLNFMWAVKAGLLKITKKYFVLISFLTIVLILIIQIPFVQNLIYSFIMMFVSLYDSNTALEIASEFGGNASGVGERVELYTWVIEVLEGNKFWGMGYDSYFQYEWVTSTGSTAIKTSIENQYLYILFKSGFLGMCSYIIMVLATMISLIKIYFEEKKLCKSKWNLSFSFLILTTLLIYHICGFSFAFFDEYKMVYILVALVFSNTKILKYRQKESIMKVT